MILNKMKFSFPSKSVNESLARMVVSSFITTIDPTLEELCDIKTAVSEAVTNAIVHGYRNGFGDIYITCTLNHQRKLTVKIQDKGCGIDDIEQAVVPMYTTAPQEERAGLGFAIMEEFVDSVKIRSTLNKGTTITLTKKLCDPPM